MKRIDYVGHRFGRLVVTALHGQHVQPSGGKRVVWFCLCDCGRTRTATAGNLRGGYIRSCGCLRRELASARRFKHGESPTSHRAASVEYQAWQDAKKRCYDPKNVAFHNYGERGIEMCAAWRDDYGVFLRDMGRCPKGLTLDRKDVNGHYEPGNCRWVTRIVQGNNTRVNHRVDYRGQQLTIAEVCRAARSRVSPQTLRARLHRGWPLARALSETVK